MNRLVLLADKQNVHSTLAIALTCSVFCGCATLGHRPVAENVVRCREQCQAGLDAEREGRDKEAHQLYAAAVECCPVDERARRLHAESLWQRAQRTEAIEQMQEAVRLSGGEPQLLVRLGEMHLATGQLQPAARQACAAIEAAPGLASAWALEGDVLRASGDPSAALERYHRALVYRDDYPEVQFAVAEIYFQQRRYQRALSTLVALSQQYEPHRQPQRLRWLRGLSYKALERYDEAAEELEMAARFAPPTPELLYELAHSQMMAGQTAAARLTAQQALALAPAHADSRQLMAQLERNQSPGGGTRRFY